MNKFILCKEDDFFNNLKKRKIKNVFIFIFLFAILILSLIFLQANLLPLGGNIFLDRLTELFKFSNKISDYPNYNLWILSLDFLWLSIRTALIGTSIGFILGLFTSYFQNEKLFHIKPINYFVKIFIPTLRALPTIFFIFYFSYSFSSQISLILVYSWFSWIWIHKYISEYYLGVNYQIYWNMVYEGKNHFHLFKNAIWPQIKNKIIALFLYSFEANIRWSSILGVLGLSGIGELIYKASNNEYESMGIPVVVLMLFVIFLEIFNILVKKLILPNKNNGFLINGQIEIKKFNFKKTIKFLIFFLFLSLLIYALASIDFSGSMYYENSIIQNFFAPNWNSLINDNFNIWFDIYILFLQAFLIIFIAVAISFLFIYLTFYKLFGAIAYLGVLFLGFLRAIPFSLFLFFINPLFDNPVYSIVLILGFTTGLTLAKNCLETLNKIEKTTIEHFQILGFSKNKIFIRYAIYFLAKDFFNFSLFNLEDQFRNLITYGKFGSSSIGFYIDFYFNGSKKEFDNMASFVWVSFFINCFVIFAIYLLKNRTYFINASINYFKNFDFKKCLKFK